MPRECQDATDVPVAACWWPEPVLTATHMVSPPSSFGSDIVPTSPTSVLSVQSARHASSPVTSLNSNLVDVSSARQKMQEATSFRTIIIRHIHSLPGRSPSHTNDPIYTSVPGHSQSQKNNPAPGVPAGNAKTRVIRLTIRPTPIHRPTNTATSTLINSTAPSIYLGANTFHTMAPVYISNARPRRATQLPSKCHNFIPSSDIVDQLLLIDEDELTVPLLDGPDSETHILDPDLI